MFWNEESKPRTFTIPENVVDLSFKINCKLLPADHAWPLYIAIKPLLPWIDTEPQLAIHRIYIPQSGNGWERADDPIDEIIHLSRRTRLKIRVPRHRVDEVLALEGQTVSVAGNELVFGSASILPLSSITTIVSRYVFIPGTDNDEHLFLETIHNQLQSMQIEVRKMLCGKSHTVTTANSILKTRSLMLADLTPEESIRLQENGLGQHQLLGCGIFVPQKGIKAVNDTDE